MADEPFANPVAPTQHVQQQHQLHQQQLLQQAIPAKPLTNEDFRKLMMTPRSVVSSSASGSSSSSSSIHSVASLIRSSNKSSHQLRRRPVLSSSSSSSSATSSYHHQHKGPTGKKRAVGETSIASDGHSEKDKKRDMFKALKDREKDVLAELATRYRDRAKERRDGANPDYAGTSNEEGLTASLVHPSSIGLTTDLKAKSDYAERRRQMIEESKFLGGDMQHTHLVKGLDYALLQKVKAEIQAEEASSSIGIGGGAGNREVKKHTDSIDRPSRQGENKKTRSRTVVDEFLDVDDDDDEGEFDEDDEDRIERSRTVTGCNFIGDHSRSIDRGIRPIHGNHSDGEKSENDEEDGEYDCDVSVGDQRGKRGRREFSCVTDDRIEGCRMGGSVEDGPSSSSSSSSKKRSSSSTIELLTKSGKKQRISTSNSSTSSISKRDPSSFGTRKQGPADSDETAATVTATATTTTAALDTSVEASTLVSQEESNVKSMLALNILKMVKLKVPERNELFLPRRMAYLVDLENESANDIPITVIRSKAECPSLDPNSVETTNAIVINKLIQIIAEKRNGLTSGSDSCIKVKKEIVEPSYEKSPRVLIHSLKGELMSKETSIKHQHHQHQHQQQEQQVSTDVMKRQGGISSLDPSRGSIKESLASTVNQVTGTKSSTLSCNSNNSNNSSNSTNLTTSALERKSLRIYEDIDDDYCCLPEKNNCKSK